MALKWDDSLIIANCNTEDPAIGRGFLLSLFDLAGEKGLDKYHQRLLK